MEIEIYSDVVCPWCYVGERRLATAVASFDGEIILRWRAFQLDPAMPRTSQPLLRWLGERFGGLQEARQAMMHVTAVAASESLTLDFDRAVISNSFDAHRLLWFADQPEAVLFGACAETQQDLARALHRAHFTDGLDIGSPELLVSLAVRVGLEAHRVTRLLEGNEGTADVRAQLARAHDLGITSVPTFVIAGRYAVTGAQEVGSFRSILDEVLRREGMAPTLRQLIPSQRCEPICDDDSRVA